MGHVFSPQNILDLAGVERLNRRSDKLQEREPLVLDDEGQAQIVLSKIRSSCELIMLDAQAKLPGSWRYASISWNLRWRAR